MVLHALALADSAPLFLRLRALFAATANPTLPAAATRLALSLVLGAAVGLEREIHNKPGGIRTSAALAFATALITLLSQASAHLFGDQAERVTAQIVSGIGFLGAGAILRDRGGVTGLTSAASIFVVAAIGMTAGSGLAGYAILGTAIVLAAMFALGWAEIFFSLKFSLQSYLAIGEDADAMMEAVLKVVRGRELTLSFIDSLKMGERPALDFGVLLSSADRRPLLADFQQCPEFRHVLPTGRGMRQE